jgi:SiaC family regulatory phosphoprotein
MIVMNDKDNTLPYFSFDEKTGIMELRGRMIALSIIDYFRPILQYLRHILTGSPRNVVANISLDYINSMSSKELLKFFLMLKDILSTRNTLTVNWYYDSWDESMLEDGEDYQQITGLPFNFIVR